jgi:cytochrome c2
MIVILLMSFGWWIHRSSVDEGERLATDHCGSCHDLSAKKTNKKGPFLWGIVNRRAGIIDEFSYSEAFRKFADSRRFSWTEANLDVLITDPDRLIPGTRMAQNESDSEHAKAFEGMQNLDNRRELIVFLRTLK